MLRLCPKRLVPWVWGGAQISGKNSQMIRWRAQLETRVVRNGQIKHSWRVKAGRVFLRCHTWDGKPGKVRENWVLAKMKGKEKASSGSSNQEVEETKQWTRVTHSLPWHPAGPGCECVAYPAVTCTFSQVLIIPKIIGFQSILWANEWAIWTNKDI